MTKHRNPLWRLWPLLLLIVLTAGIVAAAYLKPLPAIQTRSADLPHHQAQTVALPWPAYGEGAFGAVGYGVLSTAGDQTPQATASIAKVLTVLCVLQQKPLAAGASGPNLTFSQADVDIYNKYQAENGSVVPVQVGESMTEYQALQAMLLPSANNIAESLADWAFGSIDAYTAYANKYAQQQGWISMTITDPSGFLPTTVASAHDLTLLGIQAIQNPVVADIVNQPTATLPGAGQVRNYNLMLGRDGVEGIKTGNNDGDTGAFLFAAKQTIDGTPVTVVGALMDAPDLGTALYDSLPLVRSAQTNFSAIAVAQQGQTVATYEVPWQGPVAVTADGNLKAIAWNGSTMTPNISLKSVAPGVSAGQSVGTIRLPAGSQDSATVSLRLQAAIRQPTLWWRIRHLV